jgi:hypothetical protein
VSGLGLALALVLVALLMVAGSMGDLLGRDPPD